MNKDNIISIIRLLESDAERYRNGKEHVDNLFAMHNADLNSWCLRQKRRNRLIADTVIAASLIALIVTATLPQPDGSYISNAECRSEILNNIDQTLAMTS